MVAFTIRHAPGNSPDKVAAHHVCRKILLPEAEFQTGNGATLCFTCHREHHEVFIGKPDLAVPMDPQGGEQIEKLAELYAMLCDALERGLLRDDFYFLSDSALAKFKIFQGFDPYLDFGGYRIEQACSIWNQSPFNVLSSVIHAQGLGVDPMMFVRGLKEDPLPASGSAVLRIYHFGG